VAGERNLTSSSKPDTKTESGRTPLLRQSDVTAWGMAAIATVGVAFVASNLSAAVPVDWLAALHETRVRAGAILPNARTIEALRADLTRSQRANATLRTRMDLLEGSGTLTARRVGALEASVPVLLGALPGTGGIDTTITTAGINTGNGPGEIAVEGGTMLVRQVPLFVGAAPGSTTTELLQPIPFQPMPPALTEQNGAAGQPATASEQTTMASATIFGMQIGPAVGETAPQTVWSDVVDLAGTYLIGLDPLLVQDEQSGEMRLVAGPLSSFSEALGLCSVIRGLDLACKAASYEGEPVFAP
jgi:hypothetical protein